MQTTHQAAPLTDAALSSKAIWAGRIMSGVVILFLTVDGAIKLVPLAVVIDSMTPLGYPPSAGLARFLGILTLACTALYALPRTSVLSAILLTGYMGGAMATHLRIGSPLFTHVLFGLYLGLLVWGGLFLRDPLLRRLLPLRP